MTATAMLESNVLAAPPDLAPPQATDPRMYFEQHVVRMMAGLSAERRALQGSEPGWVRRRTRDELRAYHEAGHATAAWVFGLYTYKLSIVRQPSVKVGRTGIVGGFAHSGERPEAPTDYTLPAEMETDLRRAAHDCLALSLVDPSYGWRSAVRISHRLRAQTRALVDRHWYQIIALADELAKRKELGQAEIECVLKPRHT
jgi:hypothetical protein